MTPIPLDDTSLPLTSADVTADTLAALRDLLPAAFTEGKLDVGCLQQLLGDAAASGPERYGLTWAGKSEALRAVQSLSTGTLAPAPEESVNFDTSENLILEGDNLEILKLLQKSYHGKVKMIYIDPPYNTGNEFIYPDNFREGLADYLKYSGQVSGEGLKMTVNAETGGRYHSNWLTMMYPRLFLARNLLRDDGVIFVSIDDHEVHNLRELMNELFGEENFVTQITVLTNPKGRVLSKHFAESHDYLLVYSRSAQNAEFSVQKSSEQILKDYTQVDKDGRFRILELRNTHRQFGRFNRKDLFYPLYVTPTSENEGSVSLEEREKAIEVKPIWDDGFEGCWTWGLSKAKDEGRLLIARKVNGIWKVFRKSYSIDGSGQIARKKLKTVWLDTAFYTEKGQSAFNELLPGGLFQSPKPVGLLKTLLELSTAHDDIVLDFFAGSGTMGQAVLQLNKEDSGSRKFILTQLPEPSPANSDARKAGYETIAEITKERVRRVIARMSANATPPPHVLQTTIPIGVDAPASDSPAPPDLGFKVFKLTSSNFKTWNADTAPKDAAGLAAQLALYTNNIEPGRSPDDILYELLLKAGLPLTARVEKIGPLAPNNGGTGEEQSSPPSSTSELGRGGQEFYSIADGVLLVCLADPILPETIAAMQERRPQRVICLDTAFHGNDQLKTNTVLEMKSHGIEFRTV